jgi:hypothetical protein
MHEWVIRDDGSWEPVESTSDSIDDSPPWTDQSRLQRHLEAARQQIERSHRLARNARRLLDVYRAWRLPTSPIQQ